MLEYSYWQRKRVLDFLRRLSNDSICHFFEQKHANRGQEIPSTKNVNKMSKESKIFSVSKLNANLIQNELVTPVSWDMICSIGKDTKEFFGSEI